MKSGVDDGLLILFQDLTVENVANVYDLAEAYHALSLRHTCVLFILEQHKQMCSTTGSLIPPLSHVSSLLSSVCVVMTSVSSLMSGLHLGFSGIRH